MTPFRLLGATALLLCGAAGACRAQQDVSHLAVSSDPELARLAASLLPDLAERAGLELHGPVRIERRSRTELVRYLEEKLDHELPPDEADATVAAYALLGLVPGDLDLRSVLLALYTEQVAGFYDPDSTALFVMDDQPEAALEGLMVHELVHAVQDQNTDLDALTDPALGNDRAVAAQSAIEGHATLVMLEVMTERMAGAPVDLSEIPDFATQMRPVLESMRGQFPALAEAPPVIQESLLFPYLEGTGFVQSLWLGGGRVAPFGPMLPTSTEQVADRSLADAPVTLSMTVEGGTVLHDDVLGSLESGILLATHGGAEARALSAGWDGDRYALVEIGPGRRGLAWAAVWEDAVTRDRVAAALLTGLGPAVRVESFDLDGHPATLLQVGDLEGVSVRASVRSGP